MLKTKFKLDLDDKEINYILELINNTFLIKNILNKIKDVFIKLYFTIKCNRCIDNSGVQNPSTIIKNIENKFKV